MEELAKFSNFTVLIGIDLGDKPTVVVILDQDGAVIEESRIYFLLSIEIWEFFLPFHPHQSSWGA